MTARERAEPVLYEEAKTESIHFLSTLLSKLIVTLLFCYYVRSTFTLKRKNVTVYTNQEQIMTFSSNFELPLLLNFKPDSFIWPLSQKRIKSKQNETQFILLIRRLQLPFQYKPRLAILAGNKILYTQLPTEACHVRFQLTTYSLAIKGSSSSGVL